MKEIFVDTLPSNESHDTFDRERSSVNKISVEKIFIFRSWILIEFKNICQIIILAVNVSADCKLLLVFDLVLNQGRVFLDNFFTLFNELEGVSLMEAFLVFIMFHEFNDPEN